MKNINFILFISLINISFFGCSDKKDNEYVIRGTVDNSMDINQLRLVEVDGKPIDTAVVINGKFIFKKELKYPIIGYLVNDSLGFAEEIILNTDSYQCKLSKTDSKIEGGDLHNALMAFKKNDNYQQLAAKFISKNDSLRFEKLSSDRQVLLKSELNQLFHYLYDIEEKHYLDLVKNEQNSPLVRLFSLIKIPNSTKISFTEATKLVKELEKETGKFPVIQKYIKYITKQEQKNKIEQKTAIGANYFNVSGKDINGNVVKLSDIIAKNKFVILEFWASWCKPCIAEIPNLKKAYANYKSKGLEIFSISIDNNHEKWKDALATENTPWVNVIGGKGFNNYVITNYGITTIPASFLISNKGKIIAKNTQLRMDNLQNTLLNFIN